MCFLKLITLAEWIEYRKGKRGSRAANQETTTEDHIIHYDGLDYGFNSGDDEKYVDLGCILKGETEVDNEMRR